MSETRNIDCPRDDLDNEACEGTVAVECEYEPGDNNYGADADGNRGVRVRGYWSCSAASKCTKGHELTADEIRQCEEDAEEEIGDASAADPSEWYDEE